MEPGLPADLVAALATVTSAGLITGAGVSAESGIQTYRGQGGLYDDEAEGDAVVEALSAPTLASDPARTWRVVSALARKAVDARPSAAHEALVRIEERLPRCVLLTQNVDGLHARAGSRNVIEIHGNVRDTVCLGCGCAGHLTAAEIRALAAPPRCDACGSMMRPDVVLFGEMLPEGRVRRLVDAFLEDPPDLVLVAGTTGTFPYISQPVLAAGQAGRLTIEVNPEATGLSEQVRWSLRGTAGHLLPQIASALDAD